MTSPTRFKGLGYAKITRNVWMCIDLETGAQIGPHYRSKGELLADLGAFARERGFETFLEVAHSTRST